MAREAQERRRNRPSFFIDISVPRNVDPEVGGVTNLFVFDVDDLEAVVASNLREREREAVRAAAIVEAEVAEFRKSLHDIDLGSTIASLKGRLHDIAGEELRRRSGLGELNPGQERAVERMLASAVNKISHPLIQCLRLSLEAGDEEAVRAWRECFRLEDESEAKASLKGVLDDAFGRRMVAA
jgi:glutamyl-tRNA reductase